MRNRYTNPEIKKTKNYLYKNQKYKMAFTKSIRMKCLLTRFNFKGSRKKTLQ